MFKAQSFLYLILMVKYLVFEMGLKVVKKSFYKFDLEVDKEMEQGDNKTKQMNYI